MKIELDRFEVTKLFPLTISTGTSAGSENLLISVVHEGIVGIGEMAPSAGGPTAENIDTTLDAYDTWLPLLEGLTPWDIQLIEQKLAVQDHQHAAFCGLECALHDWIGKKLNLPLWKLLGLDLGRIPPTSLTIGINPPEIIRERVPELLARTQPRFLKVKLGNPLGIEADKASFLVAQEAACNYCSRTGFPAVGWRVDANGGWSVDGAREMMVWLATRGVEFVEQPLPRGQEADLRFLFHDRPLPIYLDETVRVAADVALVADTVDGVNLKFMKCGGVREALRIIHVARAHRLKVMIGCMSETSVAITAASHLGTLVDALDLDSHLNLNPDPFVGARYTNGRVVPTDAPGLGVFRRTE